MKQLFALTVVLIFIKPSFATESPQPQAPSEGKVLVFVMPGKTPTTTNLITGEVKLITPKVKTEKGDNN